MIGENVRKQIEERIQQLIEHNRDLQFTSPDDLPKDNESFILGEYPEWLTLYWPLGDGQFDIAKNVVDAAASTTMALWFMSQAVKDLQRVTKSDTQSMCDELMLQLSDAKEVPRFFQGNTKDVIFQAPEGAMGWWPLIDGYRFPAVIGDWLVDHIIEPTDLRKALANNADGDFWSWCMAVNNTTPDTLEYRVDINSTVFYEPLLGSRFMWDELAPQAQTLVKLVYGDDIANQEDMKLPIGTYYTENATIDVKQNISGVVNVNILSAIPLLDGYQPFLEDINNAMSFIRKATLMAMDPENPLTWEDHSYDYFPIEFAPLAYAIRAQKRIFEIKQELGREDYPDLMDEELKLAALVYLRKKAREYLDTPNVSNPNGKEAYTNLIFVFNAMVNLRYMDNTLLTDEEDWSLYMEVMQMLFINMPEADYVVGTGPYPLPLDAKLEISSVAFITPPLIESYALFLLVEGEN